MDGTIGIAIVDCVEDFSSSIETFQDCTYDIYPCDEDVVELICFPADRNSSLLPSKCIIKNVRVSIRG